MTPSRVYGTVLSMVAIDAWRVAIKATILKSKAPALIAPKSGQRIKPKSCFAAIPGNSMPALKWRASSQRNCATEIGCVLAIGFAPMRENAVIGWVLSVRAFCQDLLSVSQWI